MKKIQKQLSLAIAACVVIGGLESCGRAEGNFQGREYMPDMAHTVTYEGYTYGYYQNNRWGGADNFRQFYKDKIQNAKPLPGTIARGQQVYHYQDTEDERTRAMNEITQNPIKPQTDEELKAVLERGKNLYTIYCAVCHGEKGDGNGALYNNGSGPYPNKPASYISADFIKNGDSDGRYYHAIVYGKNVMMSHADKLNHMERWEVIHYIRSLQAAANQTKYDLAAANRGKANVVATDSTATAAKPH